MSESVEASDPAALRRLLEVVSDAALAAALIERGIRSAIQLAELPRSEFAARCSDLFGDDPARIDDALGRARAIRRRVLLAYMRARETGDPGLPISLVRKRRAP